MLSKVFSGKYAYSMVEKKVPPGADCPFLDTPLRTPYNVRIHWAFTKNADITRPQCVGDDKSSLPKCRRTAQTLDTYFHTFHNNLGVVVVANVLAMFGPTMKNNKDRSHYYF